MTPEQVVSFAPMTTKEEPTLNSVQQIRQTMGTMASGCLGLYRQLQHLCKKELIPIDSIPIKSPTANPFLSFRDALSQDEVWRRRCTDEKEEAGKIPESKQSMLFMQNPYTHIDSDNSETY